MQSTTSRREATTAEIRDHRVIPAPSAGRGDLARAIERRTRIMRHVAHGLSAGAIAQIEGLSLRRVQRILETEVDALTRFADASRAQLARRLPAGLERSEEVLRRIAEDAENCTPAERIMATRAMTDVRRALAKLVGLEADVSKERAGWYEAIAAADRADAATSGKGKGRVIQARAERPQQTQQDAPEGEE